MRNISDAAHETTMLYMQNQDTKDKGPHELSKLYLDTYLTIKGILVDENSKHESNYKLFD